MIKVRTEEKGFAQRQPDALGGWIWNLDGVRRVPYRLPELIEALSNDRPVFIAKVKRIVMHFGRLVFLLLAIRAGPVSGAMNIQNTSRMRPFICCPIMTNPDGHTQNKSAHLCKRSTQPFVLFNCRGCQTRAMLVIG